MDEKVVIVRLVRGRLVQEEVLPRRREHRVYPGANDSGILLLLLVS